MTIVGMPSRIIFLALTAALFVFTASPAQAAAPPTISATAISEVTETEVTLGALVNPNERKVTDYHFEYITLAAYEADGNSFGIGTESSPPGELPTEVSGKGDIAAGKTTIENVSATAGAFGVGQTIEGPGIPAETEINKVASKEGQLQLTLSKLATVTATGATLKAKGPQPVFARLSGLPPGTAYRARLSAKNNQGTTLGEEIAFSTYLPAPGFGPCSNDPFRTGQFAPPGQPSAALPECRAYEQASPIDKNGADLTGPPFYLRASTSGDAITFTSTTGVPGGEGAQSLPVYLAKRGQGEAGPSWSTRGLLPPQELGEIARLMGWTPDLSQTFSYAERYGSPNEVAIFSIQTSNGAATQVSPYSDEMIDLEGKGTPSFAATTADGSQALFEANAALPASPATGLAEKPNLYLWDRETGELSLVDVMNDGQPPVRGAFAGPYDWAQGTNALSLGRGGTSRKYYTQALHVMGTDGSVYFTAIGSGRLYKRINPTEPQSVVVNPGQPNEECTEPTKACTIQVSGSEKENGGGSEGHDSAGEAPAAFMAASADGSKAFFTSSEKLTNDATTGPEPGAAAIVQAEAATGGNPEPGFIPKKAVGLAQQGEYIYWANPTAGEIGRAKINASGEAVEEEDEFIAGIGIPRYVAVDEHFVYWTDTGSFGETGQAQIGGGSIGRARFDGSEPVEDIEPEFIPGQVETEPGKFTEQVTNPQGIAVGPCEGGGQCIYWGMRANLSALREEANVTLV